MSHLQLSQQRFFSALSDLVNEQLNKFDRSAGKTYGANPKFEISQQRFFSSALSDLVNEQLNKFDQSAGKTYGANPKFEISK